MRLSKLRTSMGAPGDYAKQNKRGSAPILKSLKTNRVLGACNMLDIGDRSYDTQRRTHLSTYFCFRSISFVSCGRGGSQASKRAI